MPQPRNWFAFPDHVNDFWQNKALCIVRAGNSKLGNRMKNIHGKQWKECPWRLKEGERVSLAETHVVLSCLATRRVREREGVADFRNLKLNEGLVDLHKILSSYLGQDGATSTELLSRGASIQIILQNWLDATENL